MNAPVDPDPRSRALKEAIEREAATAEILQIIASSPTDTQPVFDAIVRSGLRLFADAAISIALPEGDKIRAAAVAEHDSARAEAWRNRFPFPLHRDYMHGVAILDAKTLDIPDVANAPPDVAVGAQNFLASGYRAITIMPMMRHDAAIGALSVVRRSVGPLSDEQLALLKTFAAQAVIAIENTRLVNELRQRTDDLTESLEQQTATSEVLRIISSSPGELEPVFQVMLKNATHICEAKFGILYSYEAEKFRTVAMLEVPPAFAEWLQLEPRYWDSTTGLGRLVQTKKAVHIPDVQAERLYVEGHPQRVAFVKMTGVRTFVAVPLLKDDELIGSFCIFRQEVRPFTDKQIALVTNFAAQAVIAIENVRLLKELHQRTDDLTESLEQQTTTADMLKVISRSAFDLQTVLEALIANAVRLSGARQGFIFLRDGDVYKLAVSYGATPEFKAHIAKIIIRPERGYLVGRVALNRQPVHILDALTDPDYQQAESQRLGGYRTMVGVPMLREDTPVGVIVLWRNEVRAFTAKQIELVTTFADQAVIAIENVRLFDDVRQRTDDLSEALEQQTAASEVLQVISSSPGELEPVFNAMLENATRICEAKFGNLALLEGDALRMVALHGAPPAYAEERQRTPLIPLDSVLGRLVGTRQTVHVADIAADENAARGPIVTLAGARTLLVVPMLKDDQLIGAIGIYRQEVRPFTDKQIALVTNFAAQAVIAIENARLLNELRRRTGELAVSLEQQTATSEILASISGSMTDSKPVFEAIVRNLLRLFGTGLAMVQVLKDGMLHLEAASSSAEFEILKQAFPQPMDENSGAGRCMIAKQVLQFAPVSDDPAAPPLSRRMARAIGFETVVFAPMMRGESVFGAIATARPGTTPFTEKEVELITTFADQAVIAIENARLLTELRQRTDDLSESLEQQTATSEVLKVISSSPGALEPVFQTILENATRLCEAKYGSLLLCEGDAFRIVAMHNAPPALFEMRKRDPNQLLIRPGPASALGRSAKTKEAVQIANITADRSYLDRDPARVATVEVAGYRAQLSVPMLKDDVVIGVINIFRQEIGPFTDKQVVLVKDFAAQAVIAIENTRLLTEVRQQASQLEAQSQELRTLNQGLEQRVDEQVGEIERMGRLRRFLPPQVADLIVSSGSEKQLESHRREITALFCDLRGFTGFSETSDPEDVMALLREYHKAIGEIIFRHGGTLERFAGDGVMVIFNDPVPLPNPALSAVQMALEMRAAIGALIEKWRRLGHELGFGIGISHGYATLGTIGFEGRFDYAAIGTVSNVASRLCDEAAPGQILVSPRVLLAVESAVSVEPVREMALKGIRRPMLVHNVVDAKA